MRNLGEKAEFANDPSMLILERHPVNGQLIQLMKILGALSRTKEGEEERVQA